MKKEWAWIFAAALWETVIIGAMVLIVMIILSALCQAQGFGVLGQMQTKVSLPWTEHIDHTLSKKFGISIPFKWGHIEYGHTFVRNLLWTVPLEKEIQLFDVKIDKPFNQEVSWSSHRLEITEYFGNIRPCIGLLKFHGNVQLSGETSEKKPFNIEKSQRATMILGGITNRFGVNREATLVASAQIGGGGHGMCSAMGFWLNMKLQNCQLHVGWSYQNIHLKSLDLIIREQGPYARLEVKW